MVIASCSASLPFSLIQASQTGSRPSVVSQMPMNPSRLASSSEVSPEIRHCEEPTGPALCGPDDKLRDEAIQALSFRDGPKDQTSDVQLHIGESRDCGFDAEPVIGLRLARTRWHRPGMTI